MKQREENSRAVEEHNVNTDDYLLWKSEHEPYENKSVSFSSKMKNREHVLFEYVEIASYILCKIIPITDSNNDAKVPSLGSFYFELKIIGIPPLHNSDSPNT